MLDFRTFLENMKMSSSLFKILKTGLNVFKSNYHVIEKQKNITKYKLYTNESKNNRRLLFVKSECGIKLIFYEPSWMLQLSEFVWTLRSSAWLVFNNFLLIDTTDGSKISICDQKRLLFAVSIYPLSVFANTPFMWCM